MEYRTVGNSGLVVSEVGFGAATFGGVGDFFGAWGSVDVDEARAMVDACLDAGVTLFDTADVYSDGASEEILGAALKGRRDDVIVSTKAALPTGTRPTDAGTSRSRLIGASMPRSDDSTPIASTSSNSMRSTPARRSRRRSTPSTTSCARARSAMSECRISVGGN